MDFLTDLQPFFDWLQDNPVWAGVMVFIVAMAESLLVVGVLVPGAFIMLSFGALVGTGFLGLWETLLLAFLGAIVGDAISFWIGYYFKDVVPNIWPFNKNKHLLENGKVFFARHGGKSVVLGRFVGPLRAVVPTIAGMMQMRPEKFFLFNIISAAGWAPAYLLPGVAFGASLGLASEIATRLGILFVVVVVLLVAIVWIIKKLSKAIGPKLDAWVLSIIHWGESHPLAKIFVVNLVDSQKKPQGALFFWFAVLVISFGILLSQVVFYRSPFFVSINSIVTQFFSAIHFSWLDQVFSVFHQLGNPVFLGAVFLVVTIGFIRFKLMQAFWYFVFFIAASIVIVELAAFVFDVNLWHIVVTSSFLGALAVFLGSELGKIFRRVFYSIASVLAFIISFSALYYGDVSVSTWLFGLSFSLAMVVFIGLSYRRHAHNSPTRLHLAISCSGLAVVFGAGIFFGFLQDEYRKTATSSLGIVSTDTWWEGAWRDVYKDKQLHLLPITFQWAATADQIRQALKVAKWEQPIELTFSSFLKWFSATKEIKQLPILPKIYAGKFEVLQFTKSGLADDEQYTIRLWPAVMLENKENKMVWLGNISQQKLLSIGSFAHFPSTIKNDVRPELVFDRVEDATQKKLVRVEIGAMSEEILLISYNKEM